MANRSAVRHEKFSAEVVKLARKHERVDEVIDGAVWEIERNPERCGVYIREIDCWQARLDIPPEVLLMYCFNRRIVHMLTILPAAPSAGFN
jgi:hypothetical protein